MRFVRAWLAVGLIGVCSVLGCSEDTRTMKGLIPGTGPEVDKDMKLKSGKMKPMPPEPPLPQPPPLGKR
jgi:hypothetical protein